VGAHARRRWRTGKPDTAPAPDLVNRDFDPARADQVWAADVTQFWTAEGWLYFAGVIDLFSRRVVGWAMSASPDADLVIDALVMAFERRRPDEKPIHHSDRGGIGGFQRSSQHLDNGGVPGWELAGNKRRRGRCETRCTRRGGRRSGSAIRCSGSGSGSRKGCRVRTRHCRWGVIPRWE
jgi:transposase InsO family protein